MNKTQRRERKEDYSSISKMLPVTGFMTLSTSHLDHQPGSQLFSCNHVVLTPTKAGTLEVPEKKPPFVHSGPISQAAHMDLSAPVPGLPQIHSSVNSLPTQTPRPMASTGITLAPGDDWQCLETFLVVTQGVLLASSGYVPRIC